YILTGPISSVTAGQYIVGLGLDLLKLIGGVTVPEANAKFIKNWGSVVIACLVTLYFYYQNLRGIHESSSRALSIMKVTAAVGAIMLLWCGVTLVVRLASPKPEERARVNPVPSVEPRLVPRINHTVDPPHEVDPMGFLAGTGFARKLRGEPVLLTDEKGNPV